MASAIPRSVYLIRHGQRYKIGSSQNPHARLWQVVPPTETDAQVVHVIPSDNAFKVESALHERFADSALGGEWFNLDADAVVAICRLGRTNSADELPPTLKKPPTPPPPDSQDSEPEPPTSETVRVSGDLMEMLRDICFHTRDERNRRLKLAQYLDGLLRPVVLREYEAFQKRRGSSKED